MHHHNRISHWGVSIRIPLVVTGMEVPPYQLLPHTLQDSDILLQVVVVVPLDREVVLLDREVHPFVPLW